MWGSRNQARSLQEEHGMHVYCAEHQLSLSHDIAHLHRHGLVIHFYLLGQEVRPDGGLVLLCELPLHVLVHQAGLREREEVSLPEGREGSGSKREHTRPDLAHATVAQDDDLQQTPVSSLARHSC